MILAIPLAFLAEWFERKVTARIQRRIGPKYTGPFGILQPIADFLKLFGKEEITIGSKEESLIPYLVLLPPTILLTCFLFLPFPSPIISFKGDVIFLLFLYSLAILSFVAIGYLVPNPYSNIGAGRLLQIFTSFEFLFIISVVSAVIVKDSLTLEEISTQEIPLVILLPLSFAGYLLSSAAKLGFTPFDIPEAPTEIAGGWKCELTGRNLAMVRFSYDLELLFLSSLGSLVFFGYHSFSIFIIETFSMIVLLSIIKNTTSRLRVDQAIYLLWGGAIPLSLLQLLLIGVWIWSGISFP